MDIFKGRDGYQFTAMVLITLAEWVVWVIALLTIKAWFGLGIALICSLPYIFKHKIDHYARPRK